MGCRAYQRNQTPAAHFFVRACAMFFPRLCTAFNTRELRTLRLPSPQNRLGDDRLDLPRRICVFPSGFIAERFDVLGPRPHQASPSH